MRQLARRPHRGAAGDAGEDPLLLAHAARHRARVLVRHLDDLVEESQVILSPLNAKYGDSSAGLINIIEKTGSNEFAGTIRVKLDRSSWTAQRPLGYTRNGNVAGSAEAAFTDSLSRVYEFSISGPIIKDRFTFTYGTRSQPTSLVSRQAGSLTNAPVGVLKTNSSEVEAKFSPDGHWLSYTSEETGRPEIYVVPYPALNGKWQVSTAGGAIKLSATSGITAITTSRIRPPSAIIGGTPPPATSSRSTWAARAPMPV